MYGLWFPRQHIDVTEVEDYDSVTPDPPAKTGKREMRILERVWKDESDNYPYY